MTQIEQIRKEFAAHIVKRAKVGGVEYKFIVYDGLLEFGFSEKQVQKVLAQLETSGFIEHKKGFITWLSGAER